MKLEDLEIFLQECKDKGVVLPDNPGFAIEDFDNVIPFRLIKKGVTSLRYTSLSGLDIAIYKADETIKAKELTSRFTLVQS